MSWSLIPLDLFIENSPFPNTYTYGYIHPFVVVTTGLINDFSKDEFMFILGHDCNTSSVATRCTIP